VTHDLAGVARIITEGFLPAKLALLQGPKDRVAGLPSADRVRGMLLGLAIGDSLGNPTEGLSPTQRHARYGEIRDYLPNPAAGGMRVGLPSDDTQLSFWTLESLLEHGRLDPADLSSRFAAGEIFGIGRSVERFRQNQRHGMSPWYRCGAESAGNGALMRIAPVVLLHHDGGPSLWLDAALASIVTHRDACSVGACVAYADLLSRLIRLPAPPTAGWLLDTCRSTLQQVCLDTPYRARAARYAGRELALPAYLEQLFADATRQRWNTRQASDAWGSGAYLLESLPSALWILASHAHDPEEAITRAVNDTDDNDTIAAIVGAAVGALHGAQALPRPWLSGLLGRTTAANDGAVFRLVESAVRQRQFS
jgi:ADP-ribosylglycohydrolase